MPDLYNFLAEHLNLTYTLQLSADGKWGSKEMVGFFSSILEFVEGGHGSYWYPKISPA